MKRVLKWPLGPGGTGMIGGGPVVLIKEQHQQLTVWTLETVDQYGPSRMVHVVGTGQEIPDRLVHLGSATTAQGAEVWHVFAEPQS